MAVEISTLKPLVEGREIDSSPLDIYTVPASTKAAVKFISIYNGHASATEIVDIWMIATGDTAILANKRYTVSILPKQTRDIACSHMLDEGAKITVDGNTGAIASISVSGFEITNAS